MMPYRFGEENDYETLTTPVSLRRCSYTHTSEDHMSLLSARTSPAVLLYLLIGEFSVLLGLD